MASLTGFAIRHSDFGIAVKSGQKLPFAFPLSHALRLAPARLKTHPHEKE
jgi:hypothetical protein